MKTPSYSKNSRNYRRGASRYDLPRSVDEIDLDRLVWDPAYRRAVRPLIEADEDDDDEIASGKP
jgi:hypothetical protein